MNNIKSNKEKINIGILEIRRHIPVLYSFMKIAKMQDTTVTIFTTENLQSRLDNYDYDKNDYNFIIKDKNQSYRTFLKKVEEICNKDIDILFVNTIHETITDLTIYCRFNPKVKKILVVHHANAWLRPNFVLNFKHILRSIDTNISSFLISKIVLPKFDAINVIYAPIRDYIKENIDYNKEIFYLPTSIFEKENINTNKRKSQKIKIVIPGLIQKHRKDFSKVIPAIKKILAMYPEDIQISLLGMPVGKFGKNIREEFTKLNEKGFDINTFNGFVSDDIFTDILTNCDIILSPIRIKTRADGDIVEEYGKTVGSGVIYNAILYAKPIIIPNDFNILKQLDSSSLKYESEKDLENILIKLVENKKILEKLKEQALLNAHSFSRRNLQKYFKENIIKWYNKNN